jgi:probable rRNA maturation factor
MHEIEVQNEADYPVDGDRLRAAAVCVLTRAGAAEDSELTIVIADDEQVAALNRQFRGIDAPTDVLSFPGAPPPPGTPKATPYLGDLVIAFPYASAQAEEHRHPLNDSLALLVVHGVLHLLGYDHDTPAQRAQMWAEQAAALETLGIARDLVPTLEHAPDHDDEQS